MSVAVTSLPVPLSPVMSTVLSLLPMTRRNSKTARIRALRPTTTPSSASAAVMGASKQMECFEFRDLFTQGGLDAHVKSHLRARAPGAHPLQPHARGIALDLHELDIASVGLHERPDPRQHRFHAFSSHGLVL